jgi:hypothetical protein
MIPRFLGAIEQLQSSCFDSMVTLGNTLDSWQEEVVRMWRFSWSNGMTEGFHNKMKMLVRRAYGFRNFERRGRDKQGMKIRIKESKTADSRTCNYSSVTKELLLESSKQHISDIKKGFDFLLICFKNKLQCTIFQSYPILMIFIEIF